MEDLEKEVKRLRNQIVDLTEQNKEKLKLIEKESHEKSEMIKENQTIKKNIDDIKKSHSKAIDMKNSELKLILEQNDRQKNRIVELEAKLGKYNSSLKEPINSKNLKLDVNSITKDNFNCDKCGFSTNSLTILLNHKSNNHYHVLSCDHSDSKLFKKTDLQINL